LFEKFEHTIFFKLAYNGLQAGEAPDASELSCIGEDKSFSWKFSSGY